MDFDGASLNFFSRCWHLAGFALLIRGRLSNGVAETFIDNNVATFRIC